MPARSFFSSLFVLPSGMEPPLPKPPKFVITDYGFSALATERDVIQSAGGELAAFQCRSAEEVIAAANDADVLLVQWAPITRAVLENLPACKVIVRYGIGVDNIDLEAARARGIAVCNIPKYCIDEVADHTFAMALALSRQLPMIDHQVRQNVWKIVPPRPMPASRQMLFVTIGYGRIARAVLGRARGCKFTLAACDPYLPAGAAPASDVRMIELDEALRTADILSLHLPLNNESHHLINPISSIHPRREMQMVALVNSGMLAVA